MVCTPLSVLYEDNHLLVLAKPAGLPTMGVSEDLPSLWSLAKDYLKQKYHKPGNVYLGVVSRVDALVSGVVVFARTSKAAGRLSEQFRETEVDKRYWALVEGRLKPASATWVDWLRKDERARRMATARANQPDAQQARLAYRTLARLPRATLLEVRLETGRKHQIRVQLASRGHPILGDRKYGATTAFAAGIALHARRLSLRHPVRQELLTFEAPLPACWRNYGVEDQEPGCLASPS